MAPENTPHTHSDLQAEDPEILINNAQVEESSPQLPPYAYTVNGGVPPFQNQSPYYSPQAYMNPSVQQAYYPPQSIPQNPEYPAYYIGNPGIEMNAMPTGTNGINTPNTTEVNHLNNQTPENNTPFTGKANQSTTATSAAQFTQVPHTAPISHATYLPNIALDNQTQNEAFDYSYIATPARIAIYDDLKSAPRVIEIQGTATHEYIERIASLTYKNAKEEGGIIPYTVIREVSENFIHAQFQEIVVSIMDKGNTIRFADQGPGIAHKDLVQEPGFSSATEPMKRYIRGVGSGLPIVKDYLETTHGYIEIEDNINKGSVVTISLVASRSIHDEQPQLDIPELTENEQRILQALLPDKALGITEINKVTGIAVASIHTALSKMEEQKLVEKNNKKRKLTVFGERVALSL